MSVKVPLYNSKKGVKPPNRICRNSSRQDEGIPCLPCVKSRSITCLLEKIGARQNGQLPEKGMCSEPTILSRPDDDDDPLFKVEASEVASPYQRERRLCCIRTEGETDVGGDGIVKP